MSLSVFDIDLFGVLMQFLPLIGFPGQATLQESAPRGREAIQEEEEEQFAIAVTGALKATGIGPNLLLLYDVPGIFVVR